MRSILASLAILASTLPAHADDSGPVQIKLSKPDQPAVIRINLQHGSIKVLPHDASDSVAVETDIQPEKPKEVRPDGLRVLSSGTPTFAFSESENVVTIDYGRDGSFPPAPSDFTVHVPKSASVEIQNAMGGSIEVEDITGDVEVKSMQGAIRLKDLSGGALVETMNGEIRASFLTVAENKPLSFTSMNGAIEVHVPADAKASVRFRTQNGSILTDFSEDVLKTTTQRDSAGKKSEPARRAGEVAREAAREVGEIARELSQEIREAIREANGDGPAAPRPPKAPRPPSIPSMFGGKVVAGSLNGGGTELRAATMNGDIIVRKYSK